jgi:hypothetical protein
MNMAKWAMVVALLSFAGFARAAQDQSTQPSQQSDQKQTQTQATSHESGQSGATAHEQEDSLAQAARRAREEKKQEPKAAKVWTNDNIPTKPSNLSVVRETGSAESSATAASAETKTDQGAGAAVDNGSESIEERKAALQKDLDAAKEQLKSVRTDFDILSRKHVLDQQMYYSKPEYSSDTQGAAMLKDEETEMASKKQDVDAAQKKVDDLTAKLKELEDEASKSTSGAS